MNASIEHLDILSQIRSKFTVQHLCVCSQGLNYVTPITHYSATMLVYWLYEVFFPILDKDFREGLGNLFIVFLPYIGLCSRPWKTEKYMCIVPKCLSFILKKWNA